MVLRPTVLANSSFAVLSCTNRIVADGGNSTNLNVKSLLAQMLDVGDGLIVQAEELV